MGVLQGVDLEFRWIFQRARVDSKFFGHPHGRQNRKSRDLVHELASLIDRHFQCAGLAQHADPPECASVIEPCHVIAEEHQPGDNQKRFSHRNLTRIADENATHAVLGGTTVPVHCNTETPWRPCIPTERE